MIGVFDSGLGGISVLRAIQQQLPAHDLLYLADSAYCPYGPLPVEQVRERARACAAWLITQGAQALVVACNTATAAAIEVLRSELPVPVVGMEPGLKPAIAATRSGHVAVLATAGTLQAERFYQLLDRYAAGVRVTTVPCPALVELVETGELDGSHARACVAAYLDPLISSGVDTLVLGCTHFPPLKPLIADLSPAGTVIIDTGPAVAAQTARIVDQQRIPPGTATIRWATSGNPAIVAPALARVWGVAVPVTHATTG